MTAVKMVYRARRAKGIPPRVGRGRDGEFGRELLGEGGSLGEGLGRRMTVLEWWRSEEDSYWLRGRSRREARSRTIRVCVVVAVVVMIRRGIGGP